MAKIPQSPFDVSDAMQKHPECKTWAELSDAIGLPEKWKESDWCQNAFVMTKEHGNPCSKPVLFPHIHKARELFESVRLEDYGSNQDSQHYLKPYPNGGGMFISGLRAKGFAPFFNSGGDSYIKVRKSGEFFCFGIRGKYQRRLTVAKLRKELESDVFGSFIEPQEETRVSLEAVRHSNDKTLIICRHGEYLWNRYIAYLDPGESAFDMLPDQDKAEYAAYLERENHVKSLVSEDYKTVDFEGAKRLGVNIVYDKY